MDYLNNNGINWVYKAPTEFFFWEVGGFYQKPKDSNDNSDNNAVTNSNDEHEDLIYTEPEYDQDHESIIQSLHESSQSIYSCSSPDTCTHYK